MKARVSLVSALFSMAACSVQPRDYSSQADQIGEIGRVPQSVKLAAAEILDRCSVPSKGRHIFWHWEGQPEKAPYTLQLTHDQFEDFTLKDCLEDQLKSLKLSSEIDLGEEAPPTGRANRSSGQ